MAKSHITASMPSQKANQETSQCHEVDLEMVRRMEPIESGFETDSVYRLEKQAVDGGFTWQLREELLGNHFRKRYDSGDVDVWLHSYLDGSSLQPHFVVASVGTVESGLLTYVRSDWNNLLWLLDIRVRSSQRRRGVGTQLVDFVKKEARRGGTRGILVETQINNYPGIRFYRRNGFEICGFNDHLYSNRDLENQDVAVFLFCET